jgi:hypothetical protein
MQESQYSASSSQINYLLSKVAEPDCIHITEAKYRTAKLQGNFIHYKKQIIYKYSGKKASKYCVLTQTA